jgi:hypothetical protein
MKPTLSARMILKLRVRDAARAVAIVAFALVCTLHSSAGAQEGVAEKIERLDSAILRVQTQLEESQRELKELQQQLSSLRQQAGIAVKDSPAPSVSQAAEQLGAAVEELRERQDVQESQIATQEQTKVGSESKYPVTLSGMILMSGFVNTHAVDSAPTPTVAFSGPGATGATLRQSVLGIDVTGPHLFDAGSHADLRVDFDGTEQAGSYTNGLGFVRLRTAHAELDWLHAKAFFSFDRPLLSPDTPTSLTAVAEPALAWSGNLWAWNPQVGASVELPIHKVVSLQMQAALIDVADPPNPYSNLSLSSIIPPSTSEQSRWPGVEGRIALLKGIGDREAHFGIGGYFAPHKIAGVTDFNSWAGTMDFHFPVFSHLEFEGMAYRGQALGGLGGGAYKDFVYSIYDGETYFRTLDDMGGWIQAKQKVNDRLEFNEAFGVDNVPGYQLLPYAISVPNNYYNLARNRTFTSNVIYRPSAYLLYSIEYRRIESSFVNAPTAWSDVIGIAAGFKF